MMSIIHLSRADKAAEGEILFVQFEATQVLRQISIQGEQRAQQPGCLDVKGHHLLKSAGRHHGAQTAVGTGRQRQWASWQQGRGKNLFNGELFKARYGPTQKLALSIFFQNRNLIVVATEEITGSNCAMTIEDGA